MAKHPKLTAEKRTVLGKQVKKLRRDGFLPANVYGKDLQSTAIQVAIKEFLAVYKEVGETGLIDLTVASETKPVLIKNYQVAYPHRLPLHVDFYQVNLKEKVKTMVPLQLIGEAQAVTENLGTLLQPISEVEVEALPNDLPEHIEVAIAHLAAVDDAVTVADLIAPSGVTILTDPGQTVVKIAAPVAEEPAEETPAEGEAQEGGETPEEGKAEGAQEESADDSEKAS
jgi:large subunit ribosomal protein L25